MAWSICNKNCTNNQFPFCLARLRDLSNLVICNFLLVCHWSSTGLKNQKKKKKKRWITCALPYFSPTLTKHVSHLTWRQKYIQIKPTVCTNSNVIQIWNAIIGILINY